MKDLSFISNTNGLIVTAPADAFPSPNCSKVMCPIRGASDPEEPGFACTPQLDPGDEAPVMFTVTAEAAGESFVGAVYDTGDWTTGTVEDTPEGLVAFTVGSAELGLVVQYDDGVTYEAVTATIYDAEGNIVIEALVLENGGEDTEWVGTFNEEEFPVLIDGDAYCIELTFTPVEA